MTADEYIALQELAQRLQDDAAFLKRRLKDPASRAATAGLLRQIDAALDDYYGRLGVLREMKAR